MIQEKRQIHASEVQIWPVWSKSKITKVFLPATTPYWLSPIAYLRVNTDANFQIDMPITPRAFIFKRMEPLEGVNVTDQRMNEILIEFYARSAKPQQAVWSCIPIKTIPRFRRKNLIANVFYNWEFEITRGTEKKKSTFTYADIPLMNPSD